MMRKPHKAQATVSVAGAALLEQAWNRVKAAHSVTVTLVQTNDQNPSTRRIQYWSKKGGYLKFQTGTIMDVGNPQARYSCDTGRKTYQKRGGYRRNVSAVGLAGMDYINGKFPAEGKPQLVNWHGKKVIRIEMDGKSITNMTKMFAYLDPKTKLPAAITINLGSMTNVAAFEGLRLNADLPNSLFSFTPPKGWTQVGGGR
jgi:outer membrane lipoprotein-sorting protein